MPGYKVNSPHLMHTYAPLNSRLELYVGSFLIVKQKLALDYRQEESRPEYSWSILRLFPGLEEASLFALHHHESYDGTGYPGGLKAEEIPLGSRIVSIVDAFDAMISNRCYRKGLDHAEAIRRLNAGSGTQFDPNVLRCFLEIAELEVAGVFAATGTSIAAVI